MPSFVKPLVGAIDMASTVGPILSADRTCWKMIFQSKNVYLPIHLSIHIRRSRALFCPQLRSQVAGLDDALSVSICQVQGQLRGSQLSVSLASLKCHDLSDAAVSCGEACATVEMTEVTQVTWSCPQIQLNTTEIFLLRCKCLGATELVKLLMSWSGQATCGNRN